MGAQVWNGSEWKLEVTDELGRLLFVLCLSGEEMVPSSQARTDRR